MNLRPPASDLGVVTKLTLWLQAGLVVAGLAAAASALAHVWWEPTSTVLVGGVESGQTFRFPELGPSFGAVSAVLSLAGLATQVVWLVWQYHATRLLWDLGEPDLRIRPGWAVGWWFVPFANWVMPFIAVRELLRRSEPQARPRASDGVRLAMWWCAWVLGQVVALVGVGWGMSTILVRWARAGPGTSVPVADVIHTMQLPLIVGNVGSVIAAVVAVWIVGEVRRRQTSLVASRPPGAGAMPIPALPGSGPLTPPRPDLRWNGPSGG